MRYPSPRTILNRSRRQSANRPYLTKMENLRFPIVYYFKKATPRFELGVKALQASAFGLPYKSGFSAGK